MIRLNPDVRLGLSPEIVLALLIADGVYADVARTGVVVTSGTEGAHRPDSYHYHTPGQAVDLRIRHVAAPLRPALRDHLAARLGPGYVVLLEDTPLHIHVHYRGLPAA